jgi:integrase
VAALRRRGSGPLTGADGFLHVNLTITRLHDGRHTATALLLSENVHPRVVMELPGHSQMRTTMDIYSHVMPALAREAADRTSAVLLTSTGKGQRTATRNQPEMGELKKTLVKGVALRGLEP